MHITKNMKCSCLSDALPFSVYGLLTFLRPLLLPFSLMVIILEGSHLEQRRGRSKPLLAMAMTQHNLSHTTGFNGYRVGEGSCFKKKKAMSMSRGNCRSVLSCMSKKSYSILQQNILQTRLLYFSEPFQAVLCFPLLYPYDKESLLADSLAVRIDCTVLQSVSEKKKPSATSFTWFVLTLNEEIFLDWSHVFFCHFSPPDIVFPSFKLLRSLLPFDEFAFSTFLQVMLFLSC